MFNSLKFHIYSRKSIPLSLSHSQKSFHKLASISTKSQFPSQYTHKLGLSSKQSSKSFLCVQNTNKRFFSFPPEPPSSSQSTIQPLPTTRRSTLRQRVPFPSEKLDSQETTSTTQKATQSFSDPNTVQRIFGKDAAKLKFAQKMAEKQELQQQKLYQQQQQQPPPPPTPTHSHLSTPPNIFSTGKPPNATTSAAKPIEPSPATSVEKSTPQHIPSQGNVSPSDGGVPPKVIDHSTLPNNLPPKKRRGIIRFFMKTIKWIVSLSTLGLLTTGFGSLYIESLRVPGYNIIPPIYWPDDTLTDLSKLGYIDNYNSMMLEQLVTLLHAQYLAHLQPTLAPQWMKDLVTENGQIVSPFRNQAPPAILQVLDILHASHGMRSTTTFFSQIHEMNLRRVVETSLNPGYPQQSMLVSSFLSIFGLGLENPESEMSLLESRQNDLEAYTTISRMDIEARLCVPLLREELHKRLISLLVASKDTSSQPPPPNQLMVSFSNELDNKISPNGNGSENVVQNGQNVQHIDPNNQQQTNNIFSSIVNYFWNGQSSSSLYSQNENYNEPWLDMTKSHEYREIQRIIHGLVGEGPLSPVIRDRYQTVSRAFRRENIPSGIVFNAMHYSIQQGRRDTLLFLIKSLTAYESTLATTPHKLASLAGASSTSSSSMASLLPSSLLSSSDDTKQFMSLTDVRSLIQFAEQSLQQQQTLLTKYHIPISEVVFGLFAQKCYLPFSSVQKLIERRHNVINLHQSIIQQEQGGLYSDVIIDPQNNKVFFQKTQPKEEQQTNASASPIASASASASPIASSQYNAFLNNQSQRQQQKHTLQQQEIKALHQLTSINQLFVPSVELPHSSSFLMVDHSHDEPPPGFPVGSSLLVPPLQMTYPSQTTVSNQRE